MIQQMQSVGLYVTLALKRDLCYIQAGVLYDPHMLPISEHQDLWERVGGILRLLFPTLNVV